MLEILYYTDTPCLQPHRNENVLVLIHGLFGSGDNLNAIKNEMQKDFRVISIDLPDHGQSPWSSTFCFENYAKQVALTLQSIGVTRANFVGHSLGGKIAMYLSHINPIMFHSLIVLDIAPIAYTPRHQNVINGLTAVSLNSIENRRDAKDKMSIFVDDAGTQSFLLKSLYQDNEIWKWRFNLNLLVQDYEKLSAWPLADKTVFDGDVLFIKGSKSDYITTADQSTIMSQFPNAKAKIVDAGHWLHAEKPRLVNSLITKHLLN